MRLSRQGQWSGLQRKPTSKAWRAKGMLAFLKANFPILNHIFTSVESSMTACKTNRHEPCDCPFTGSFCYTGGVVTMLTCNKCSSSKLLNMHVGWIMHLKLRDLLKMYLLVHRSPWQCLDHLWAQQDWPGFYRWSTSTSAQDASVLLSHLQMPLPGARKQTSQQNLVTNWLCKIKNTGVQSKLNEKILWISW